MLPTPSPPRRKASPRPGPKSPSPRPDEPVALPSTDKGAEAKAEEAPSWVWKAGVGAVRVEAKSKSPRRTRSKETDERKTSKERAAVDRRLDRAKSMPKGSPWEAKQPEKVADTPVRHDALAELKLPLEGPVCELARKYRMDIFEVRDIKRALELLCQGCTEARMQEVLMTLYSVKSIGAQVVRDACTAFVGPVGTPAGTAVDMLDRFCNWYQMNMFKNAAVLDQGGGNQVSYRLGELHNVSPLTIDKIKKQFDKFDLDRSGKICYNEFVQMMVFLLKARTLDDISHDRAARFWAEIDADGSGLVDLSEFVAWYIKYFDPEGAEQSSANSPVTHFYSSFNPIIARRKTTDYPEDGGEYVA